jgi:large subunit ribosomal protein L1
MAKLSKRIKLAREKVSSTEVYTFSDAVAILKELSSKKFSESVDIAVKLGINAKKSDQSVRGSAPLPHGSGKTVRVAVFAEGDEAKQAQEAGADVVGYADLAAKIKQGEMDFDVLIATPKSMREVGKLGQILGPKGLMPNPKVGTVTPNVAAAVTAQKSGKVKFRNDKAGIIHVPIGKIDFSIEQLDGNMRAVLEELKKLKPAGAKGTFLTKISLATTMGPGIQIELPE